MHGVTTLLTLLPALQMAFAGSSASRRSQHQKVARSQHRPRAKTYTLEDKWQGQSFFDGWDFYSDADPTHGLVEFVSQDEATSAGLAYVQDDNTTVLKVDDYSDVAEGGNRKSVRISSKKSYNGGLFIADFWAMPHGCGVWPAWWSVGPSWPDAGEIDVLEGVNLNTLNQYTLHTSAGCVLDQVGDLLSAITGTILGDQCESSNANNAGCAFQDSDERSFGHGFNNIAGGVYAHLWDDDGIKMWHFARGEIPADIDAGNPDPTTWGNPSASYASSTCSSDHFYDHNLVIDTTICGDWAGNSFSSDGCPGTCAQAVANKTNFSWAQWKINYIAVYQSN